MICPYCGAARPAASGPECPTCHHREATGILRRMIEAWDLGFWSALGRAIQEARAYLKRHDHPPPR